LLPPDPHPLAALLTASDELAQAGLLSRDSGPAGLSVTLVERRNRTLLVTRDGGSGFAIKRAPGSQVPSFLRDEAAILKYLWFADPAGATRWLPRLLAYDEDRDVMITGLFPQASDLGSYHERVGRFPSWIGRAIGEALSWLHGLSLPQRTDSAVRVVAPLAIRLHEPTLEDYPDMSPANARLIAIVQSRPGLIQALDELGRGWHGNALVHDDIRFDNVLARARTRGASSLCIVDWEVAGFGDPAWDVGAAFAGYLETWILSFPIARPDALHRPEGEARHPLEAIKPAIRTMWRSYVAGSGLDEGAAGGFLRRSVLFCAARLLQAAYERSEGQSELLGHDTLLVQVADNIVARPEDAVSQLLGLLPEHWLAA